MEKQYTSNINCNACIAKVSPAFDEAENIDFWAVDLEHPDRILTVDGDISPEEMQALAQTVGYSVSPK